ncbi:MAG: hypothetical protein IJU20_01375 [Clostridia bacterium]|nr:hypothetical protein [Clostridia bacterium]
MISFTTGEIQLFHSKYILSPSLDRANFEKNFPPDQILFRDVTSNGWYHYFTVCDIRENEFIYSEIIFHQDCLCSIMFFPQHSGKDLQYRKLSPLDYNVANPVCHKWFQDVFSTRIFNITMSWGTIDFCPGDPVDIEYCPPHIIVEYTNR